MRLRTKILITYCIFFIPAFYYLTADFQKNLKFRYLEGAEETLVDQARILAGFISEDFGKASFPRGKFRDIFDIVYRDRFNARIYQLLKTHVDTRIYITDEKGILLFDSQKRDLPGTDYSRWRDVFLTLQGDYGARSSKDDPQKPAMSTLYVAAPVIVAGGIKGVLTVGKPTDSINDFIAFAKLKVVKQSLVAAILAFFLSILTMFFITRPLDHLNQYVRNIKEGKTVRPPSFGKSDIGEVGRAFEKIHSDLETKQYIEAYVQSLTHEIKSPISAIVGASELLEEDMPEDQRKRFVANIRSESKRIQALVERMLTLSSLEHQNGLENREILDMNRIVSEVIKRSGHEISKKKIRITRILDKKCRVSGDAFLLRQALINLFQNALDFSPPKKEIVVCLQKDADNVVMRITDQGPGIPGYAADRIFERFFSLQRPDSGKKSTGLGLNFVKEIILLHCGEVNVDNRPEGGTTAVVTLPIK
jgi:two-component system sensor histidine kinase CreC